MLWMDRRYFNSKPYKRKEDLPTDVLVLYYSRSGSELIKKTQELLNAKDNNWRSIIGKMHRLVQIFGKTDGFPLWPTNAS
jgi:hypothetical protein